MWAKQTNWANPDGSGRAGLRRTDRGLGLVEHPNFLTRNLRIDDNLKVL